MPKRGDPWFRFYADEWLDGTRDLTLEQRGAYIDMICLQMRYEKHLDHDYRWFAHQMHIDVRAARRLIDSLVEAMKIRRDESGLYNVRADAEISWKNAQRNSAANASAHRWKSSEIDRTSAGDPAELGADVGRSSDVANDQTRTDHAEKTEQKQRNADAARNASGIPYKREIERDIERTPPNPPKGGDVDEVLAAFEGWWSLYPASKRKVAKGECLALFRQAVTGFRRADKKGHQKILDHGRATPQQMIDALKVYVATNPDPEYVPAPATWLNQGRWLDEHATPKPAAEPWWKDSAKVESMEPDRWLKGIAQFANGIWPVDKLGPPPGHPQCVVPASVVRELKLTDKYDADGIAKPGYGHDH